MLPMPLHNDQPTLLDTLDRAALVREVAAAAATGEPPAVFGVHGDWGSGKTSFLLQLHHHLTGDCDYPLDIKGEPILPQNLDADQYGDRTVVVWFEAWRYQHEPMPVVALLQQIRVQLPRTRKLLSTTGKLLTAAAEGGLLGLDALTRQIGVSTAGVLKGVEQGVKRWEAENHETPLSSQMIRDQLDHAIEQILGKDRRLVVLIDDLDRCQSATAFRLLEGLKIYLNLSNCVFVLGMDRRILEDAIHEQLATPLQDTAGERAREYLEKLCQHVYHLPLIRDPAQRLDEWLALLLTDDRHRQARLAIRQQVGSHHLLPANARKIKSFANVLLRFIPRFRSSPDETGEREVQIMLIVAYLYHVYPSVYRMLEGPEGHVFYEELFREWAIAGQREHERLMHLKLPRAVRKANPKDREASAIGGAQSPDEPPPIQRMFPDPVHGSVVRIQSLINAVESVTEEELERFLLRA